MKQIYCLLIGLTFFLVQEIKAQPFVTKWDLSIPGSGATQLSFGVGTTGIVNYTWETIPAGMNGAGTFTGSTATITGLPAGAIIRLSIDTANFNRIHINNGSDTNRLLDVEQWGGVHWSNMNEAFRSCSNLNISSPDLPDLSNANSLSYMFANCINLNGPANINNWDISNVTNLSFIFYQATNFNQSIGLWNTQNVIDMTSMFEHAYKFNQPIGSWNTQSVTSMYNMFNSDTSFNQPLNAWNTQNVTNMGNMFAGATSFNQPLNAWNTQNVTNMGNMFAGATSFNQPLNTWNTQNVENMAWMFAGATLFNQPLSNWNIQNVVTMTHMFSDAISFNEPLNMWNTQNVLSMTGMFFNATSFNQPLSNWNTQSVQYMGSMFYGATSFNEPIGSWNTQNVTNMSNMFRGATNFNQPIGAWNIGNVLYMSSMFKYATSFNQSLENWGFSQNVNTTSLLDSSGMDCMHYSATLNGWANALNVPNGKSIGAANMKYKLNAINARNYLINVKGWTILGDALDNNNCCLTQQTTSNLTSCNSYLFNGQVYTASGIYLDTLVSATGCDSIITLNLTILQPTFNTINENACSSYLFNGQTLTSSGQYFDTLVNANGCDSILSLNLVIIQTNANVFQAGAYLFTNTSGATYQWISCNPYQIISGATNQNYTATANGDYAVIVTENGCTDTSACVTVMGIGLNENNNDEVISIYPNPTKDKIHVNIGSVNLEPQTNIEIYNTLGQLLLTKDINPHTQTELDISHLAKGIYYLCVGHSVSKVIVE
jgi:surface protein